MSARKSGSIRLKGAAANAFVACFAVDNYGAKAHHNCVVGGAFYNACLDIMRERGITPEPVPAPDSKAEGGSAS